VHPTQPMVFVDDAGKPWSLRPKGYDVSVLFPLEHLGDEPRPAWLALDGIRKPYPVSGDMCRSDFPCMVEARYMDETDTAIPADRVVFGLLDPTMGLRERARIHGASMHLDLFLRPGRYRVSVTNSSNQVIASQKITVGEK